MLIRAFCSFLVVGLLAGAMLPIAEAQSLVERGRALAQARCSGCHAIGRTGVSPNPKSPPLREIARRYKPEDLEEAFAEGIVVGHDAPEMPEFEMEPRDIQRLMAYLGSLRGR